MKTDPVIIFILWFITTWPFVEFFPLVSLSSRGINLNFLFFLFLSYLLLKFTFCIWWRFRVCSLIIRLSPFLRLFYLALALEGLFPTIVRVRLSNLDISLSERSWKLLFRHVCKSDCSWCFWLEHAFSLTKCVGGSAYNTGKSPEWVAISASAMLKRNNNNN